MSQVRRPVGAGLRAGRVPHEPCRAASCDWRRSVKRKSIFRQPLRALAGTSKVSVLNSDWDRADEIQRTGPKSGGPAHNPLPWANPANIVFNKKPKSLLVTNHASLTGLPDPSPLFAVFDVFVNDKAGKLFKNDDDD